MISIVTVKWLLKVSLPTVYTIQKYTRQFHYIARKEADIQQATRLLGTNFSLKKFHFSLYDGYKEQKADNINPLKILYLLFQNMIRVRFLNRNDLLTLQSIAESSERVYQDLPLAATPSTSCYQLTSLQFVSFLS